MNNTHFESYVSDGCGRCDRFRTPECKVHAWTDVLHALRSVLLGCGLDEAMKWGAPCYMVEGRNVLMLSALKDCCSVGFFRGAALGEHPLLVAPGPNSRYMRTVSFRSLDDVETHRAALVALVEAAVVFELSGAVFEPPPANEPVPEELEERLGADPELARAFDALTPGRRRSHILHVTGAKQTETRARRVEKCAPIILAGKGFNER